MGHNEISADVSADDNNNREKAKLLFWQGMRVSEIAKLLDIKPATVHSWKKRDAWDRATNIDKVDAALTKRVIYLIGKGDKTPSDLKELETLVRLMERTAKTKKFEKGGSPKHLNAKLGNAGRKTNKEKNFIPPEKVELLQEAFRDIFFKFDYQKLWYEQKNKQKTRNILKSRQIGATYYFGHEGGMDGVETGDNQIFMSASRAQSYIFKNYFVQFVKDVAEIELKGGDNITLWNGANLYYLAMNKNTSQGYHGHTYNDEYFWIPGFEEFRRVTSGMALHKKWRRTYFSTPSTTTHQAYPFWTGDWINRKKKAKDKLVFDVSHQALKNGMMCPDRQWRHIVTIEDAMAGGCDLFDIEELRFEYSEEDFNNLLMCQFIDDTASIFSLATMQKCMVDSWEKWEDFEPLLIRPFARRPVWIGYDPSRSRDDASVVVMAPPDEPGKGKFRILEKFRWNGLDFEYQAAEIKKLTEKYTVQYIGIDVSGMGANVFDLVKKFFPAATAIKYTVESKNQMVMKAKNVVDKGRLEFDAGWNDVAIAFMTIHRMTTPKAQQISYGADRTAETGHADVFWSIAHVLINEAIDAGMSGSSQSMMEFY